MQITKLIRQLGNFKIVQSLAENQLIINFENGVIFQSYQSIIIVSFEGQDMYYLGKNWDYSTTTAKYRNRFLYKDKNEILDDIKNGIAILI